ncbi:MAG: methyltransferase [Proteobacteria bacterium]|uniref:Methyltransferase n=1 Tax=Candidatus Avisuccinivibrio stercorigallinarum TaxID=2840704 RepID=A0A9D9DD19_9GAMM|nr:methyltransferase [Candidatus Avisuccinivibrio stercorigallinarum]
MADFNSPVTELLGRSEDAFIGRRAVFAGDIADASILHLAKLCQEALVLCDNFTAAQQMAALLGQELEPRLNSKAQYKHISVIYTALQLFGAPECDLICLLLNKSKPINQSLLAALTPALVPDGLILAAGANEAGGRSADGYLKSHGMLFKKDSARKCTLWQLNFDKNSVFAYPPHSLVLSAGERERFNAALNAGDAQAVKTALKSFALDADAGAGTAAIPPRSVLKVDTSAGELQVLQDVHVFSPGRVDEGTAQLISCLNDFARSPALDLCCGSGIVGLQLCRQGINTAFADLSAAALFLSTLNLCLNGLIDQCLGVSASDMLADLDKLKQAAAPQGFGLIAVNPPFHQGVKQKSTPARALFASVKDYLQPAGVLLCVGNAFLGYDELMAQDLPHVSVKARTTRFVTTAGSLQPLP